MRAARQLRSRLTRLIAATLCLGTATPIASQEDPFPTWKLTRDLDDSSCTLLSTREADGEETHDMFYWQVRDFVRVQSGFGLSQQELQSLGNPDAGATVDVTIEALARDKAGRARDHQVGHGTFVVIKVQLGTFVSAHLPLDILTDLEKDDELDLYAGGKLFRSVDLTGSAATVSQIGPCMASIGAHLEGR